MQQRQHMYMSRLGRYLALALFILPLIIAGGCRDSADTTSPIQVIVVTPEIGKKAPDFTLQDPDGNDVTLADYEGKVVLLDFWASWCTPCLAQIPRMKEIWEANKTKDFVILGVSLDYTKPEWKSYLAGENVDWAHVYDGFYDGRVTYGKYGLEGIPGMFILDRDGIVRDFTTSLIGDAAFQSALQAEIDK